MADRPSNNIIVQQLELLMSGRGFNFYDDKNKARADDLLVRQRASGFLGEAGSMLSTLESAFRQEYIPPSTREHPYPPAEAMAKVKEFGRLRSTLGDIETQIRGMSVPTQDKVWWRFRDEHILLEELVSYDYRLITLCSDIADAIRAVGVEDWHTRNITADLTPKIVELQAAIRERQQFLTIQVI